MQVAYHASQIFSPGAIFRFFHKFRMFKGLKVRTCHAQADAVQMHTMLLFSRLRNATDMSSLTMHPQDSASATGTDAHRHPAKKALKIEAFATMSTESCPVRSGFVARNGPVFSRRRCVDDPFAARGSGSPPGAWPGPSARGTRSTSRKMPTAAQPGSLGAGSMHGQADYCCMVAKSSSSRSMVTSNVSLGAKPNSRSARE